MPFLSKPSNRSKLSWRGTTPSLPRHLTVPVSVDGQPGYIGLCPPQVDEELRELRAAVDFLMVERSSFFVGNVFSSFSWSARLVRCGWGRPDALGANLVLWKHNAAPLGQLAATEQRCSCKPNSVWPKTLCQLQAVDCLNQPELLPNTATKTELCT